MAASQSKPEGNRFPSISHLCYTAPLILHFLVDKSHLFADISPMGMSVKDEVFEFPMSDVEEAPADTKEQMPRNTAKKRRCARAQLKATEKGEAEKEEVKKKELVMEKEVEMKEEEEEVKKVEEEVEMKKEEEEVKKEEEDEVKKVEVVEEVKMEEDVFDQVPDLLRVAEVVEEEVMKAYAKRPRAPLMVTKEAILAAIDRGDADYLLANRLTKKKTINTLFANTRDTFATAAKNAAGKKRLVSVAVLARASCLSHQGGRQRTLRDRASPPHALAERCRGVWRERQGRRLGKDIWRGRGNSGMAGFAWFA